MIALRRRALAREFMEARGWRFVWPTNRLVVRLGGPRCYAGQPMTEDERTFKHDWQRARRHTLAAMREAVRCDRSPMSDGQVCQFQPKRDGSKAPKSGAGTVASAGRNSAQSGFAN